MAKSSLLGLDAMLFDPAGADFDDVMQARIWGLGHELQNLPWVLEAVPGMNNLTVVFDALALRPAEVAEAIEALWRRQEPFTAQGRLVEAPTIYGGDVGEDLAELARRAGISVEEAVRRHADPSYSVAAVGAMPGFVYLSGLHPSLAWPRLGTPRASAPAGAVIIGGAQTGIMPITAPTGWRLIGHSSLRLFDADGDEPALLRPGDRLKFTVQDILA